MSGEEWLIYGAFIVGGAITYVVWAWAVAAISKVPLSKVLKFWEW